MFKRLVLSLLALPMLALWGDVKLPALFADHGVLARGTKTPIFGKAAPGEVVTVKLADLQGKATADAT
ncbi:MAG: sialate O-acetylesterase, partial [Lentisphaeria bacterium]|nr:sialate O-acetylesterase [Lentisphaeria bacterium]